MCNRGSLKNQVKEFGKVKFKDVFPPPLKRYRYSILRKIANAKGGLIFVPTVLCIFFIGQLPVPDFLQIITIPNETARLIIDQRSANLAAIFSITLVVIGWLITNLSVKETLSYQFLFKRTLLYPIFYYIITLIGCIMLCSLLRHQHWMDIGKAVITATYLILIALVLITFLFFRLITVVGTNFFFTSLDMEVVHEIERSAREQIIERKSSRIYNQFCLKLGLEDKIVFNTDLSNHTGINITPYRVPDKEPVHIEDIFTVRKAYRIKDIYLNKLSKNIRTVQLAGNNYYKPVAINRVISENFHPFFFHGNCGEVAHLTDKIKSAFKLGKPRKEIMESYSNLDFLCERFEKDVKEGKIENVKMSLDIFEKVFKMENQILKEC